VTERRLLKEQLDHELMINSAGYLAGQTHEISLEKCLIFQAILNRS
jgi:hypothetical protein